MQNLWNKILVVMLAAVLFAGIATIGVAEEPIKLGLAIPTQTTERWVRDAEFAQDYCEELGIDILVQYANDDASRQLSQCENLIAEGVDALIIGAVDSTSASSAVEMANSAGIPVVAYERIILNCEYDVLVQFDNFKVGAQQGQFVLENAPEGNYVILGGGPTDANSVVFHDGQMSAIQEAVDAGKINIVMDQYVPNWDPAEALSLMENALSVANNDIQGVIATNDGIAGACIEAMTAQGLTGVPISGQDVELAAIQRIKEGTQSMSIFKDTRQLSKAAVDLAVQLVNGEKIAYDSEIDTGSGTMIPTVSLEATVITADNLDVLIEAGYYTEEDMNF